MTALTGLGSLLSVILLCDVKTRRDLENIKKILFSAKPYQDTMVRHRGACKNIIRGGNEIPKKTRSSGLVV